jgi:hypothetical protein
MSCKHATSAKIVHMAGMQKCILKIHESIPLFGWAYQHGLSAVEQCFSLTANQPQPAYKPKKQPAEQDHVAYAYKFKGC